ncbi:MAG TPA: fimbrial biogenesis outer membrane usher protein [Cupriavidus sp.]|nr:fimbrial biogenesis outer membrane usher protein [Cupriavidus sp.]
MTNGRTRGFRSSVIWRHNRTVLLSVILSTLVITASTLQAMAAPINVDKQASGGATLAYSFDSKLLLGSSLGVANIERFNKASAVEPGIYPVDIYVNGAFAARKPVDFRAMEGDVVGPCLNDEFLTSSGILLDEGSATGSTSTRSLAPTGKRAAPAPETLAPVPHAENCVPLERRVPGASTAFDLSRLRLDIGVPQAQMKQVPRGFVDSANLNAGQTMGYVNYDTNYYTSSAYGARSNSAYAGINAGLNVGLWRLRQQSTYTYTSGLGESRSHWNNIRTYAERPLVSLRSNLVVGQSFTGGNLLSAVGYTGVHIESDDRMLSDSMRGYAPVVNGVANTNARVVISQNGQTIYQTTVAPGPFSIKDLNPTSYQGNLTVQVLEANGEVTTFIVPFSAVPNSLRPGLSHYSLTLGQVRQIADSNAKFADVTYERGLTNVLTANGGARISPDYQSVLGGVVFGTKVGAFGVNTAWSRAQEPQGGNVNGWRSSVNYSHTIQQTMTTFTLAGYRYSTNGYRDFIDAISSRAALQNGANWISSTYRQRDQFTVNANQNLNGLGSLSLSASTSSYYSSRSRDTQFQLSYNNHYRRISYNLSVIRQQTGMLYGGNAPGMIGGAPLPSSPPRLTNAVMFTVSIPLDLGARSASVSGSVAHSTDQGVSYQTSVSGVADTAQTLSYGFSVAGQTQNESRNFSGNLQKNLSAVTVGANYSQGNNYWQAGANARGAAVVHEGGVTLGRYLSDTFGLIEAKGAEGAAVRNAPGTFVNRFGFAIVPSLTPYRYNDVALDSKGINPNAELTGSQVRVAPYAGSSVLLKFSTLTGHAVLITATGTDGELLPFGATVLDSSGTTIGVVGQGNQVYARVPNDQGTLTVKWGEGKEDLCVIGYDLKTADAKEVIQRFEGKCRSAHTDKTAARAQEHMSMANTPAGAGRNSE